MGYPPEMFQQTHVFAVQAGQLVLDEGNWALCVQLDEGKGPEQCLLYLEGDMRGQARVPDAHRKCCRLADGFTLIARANSRPHPFDAATLAGELIHGGGSPLVLAKLEREVGAFTLQGDRVRSPKGDKGVAYAEWEILIADANGVEVDGAPVVTVKAV